MTLPSLSTWRRRVAGMRGWRRRGLAAGLGALACLALPPAHVLPVLVPAFTGLVWLLDGATDRRAAFGAGWWFGFGYFSLGFYWIGAAMLVEAEKFAWMIPFAVFGVAGVEALFTGLAGLAAWMAVRALGVLGGGAPTGPARVLLLAAAWGAGEWLRSWAFTGFPWNPVGAVWVVSDAMAQVAALVGVYGLGMVTVAAAAMPAVLGDGGAGRRSWGPVAVMAGLLVLAWGGGALRLAGATDATVPGVRLRLVQPDIPQRLKWQADLRAGHIRRQVDMSLAPPADGDPAPTHVIWGETMVPAFLDRDESARALVAQAVPPGGLVLAGAPRAPDTGGPFRVWNSLLAVDGAGRVVATYDKAHLVPFGEYVPFRSILPIDKITAGRGDFSAGPGPRAVDLPGLPPVGPQICYEIIFPGRVVGDRRPAWLLNITNDSWFGRTAGPYQHFSAARLRAVEEGLPVVRVANSGISAFIDAHGRVLSSLPLGAAGVLDGALPVALDPPPYARLGNVIPAMVGLMLIIIALFTTFRDSRRISGDRRKMERAAKYIKHINLAPKSHTYV